MRRRTLVIVNPQSGGGRTARRWPGLEARVRDVLGPLEVEFTCAPRDAERIAREAARAGVERIVVAGGDGTIGEVATGLLLHGLGDSVEIGVLPLGTGCDFARGLGLPRDPIHALAAIDGGVVRSLDAGRVEFETGSGRASACFVNVSSFGASGPVLERVSRSSRPLGGTLAFAWAAVRGIFAFRSEVVRLKVDGALVHDAPVVLAAIGNASWFGGGMQVVPAAQPDDGRLDLVIVGALGKLRLVALLARGYRGRHVEHPAVSEHRGQVIEVEAERGRVLLELDGELRGTLPARYEVLPGALRCLVASA